jgi:hypothetical protein
MVTGPKAAHLAGKSLAKKSTPKNQKTVDGSDLEAAKKPKPKPKKK